MIPMKFPLSLRCALLTPALGAIAILSLGSIVAPSRAQDPPAATFQPGFWQPQARFNPKKNLTVQIVNQTEFPLDFDIVSDEATRPTLIAAGETGTLENVGVDSYVMIYPDGSSNLPQDAILTLRFTADINERTQMIPDDNVAVITVTRSDPQISPKFLGHRTVNFQRTGAIYFY